MPNSVFNDLLNDRKLELLRDPEVLRCIRAAQEKQFSGAPGGGGKRGRGGGGGAGGTDPRGGGGGGRRK